MIQILSSIKKRRVNDERRVQGKQLHSLADQIIEQCKISIENASTFDDQTPRSVLKELNFDEED